MTALFKNNASSDLAVAINTIATTLTVAPGTGSFFPAPGGGDTFQVTVEDLETGEREIMTCTARTGDVLTVTRAQEGTSAQSFAIGATVANRLTAAQIANFLTVAGGTISGSLTIAGTLTISPGNTALLVQNKAASGQYTYQEFRTNGVVRWQIIPGDSTAEAGANAGSDFVLNRFSDVGVILGSPVKVKRSTGDVTLENYATIGGSSQRVGAIVKQVVTTTSVWTKPAGLRYLEVEIVGAGGGGGTAPTTNVGELSVAGGGGAGGHACKLYAAADLGSTITCTVGAGGGSGAAGLTTTFAAAAPVSATGGAGGVASISGAGPTGGVGGAGGAGTGGDINGTGQPGSFGWCDFTTMGKAFRGDGGSSSWGGGGAGAISAITLAGAAATGFGAGGAGGISGPSSGTPTVGGAGSGGLIVLTEHF